MLAPVPPPASSLVTSLQQPRHSPPPAEARPRVLIADDRAENLLALEAVLEPLDVEVVRASSGSEALARSAEQEFAVIVLDVMMPGVDGLETARQLKSRSASRLTPIIFLTALDVDRRRVHDGYASGAVDYLFKPMDPDVVRAKVSAFVDLYTNRRAENWTQRRRYADQAAAAAEAAYREGDQRFQLLAESVPAMVWTASRDGRVEFMNAYGAAYVGVDLHDVASLRWSRHVHADDIAITRARWKQAVRGGVAYETEVRIWSVERRAWRRHLARAVPRHDGDGTVLGWVGVNTDVEDSMRAEEELYELQLTAEREARIASDDARVDLAKAVGRLERLQALTAALSQAATPVEVATAVVANSVAALGASAGVVAMLAPESEQQRRQLRVLQATGYAAEVLAPWSEIPVDASVPLADAVRRCAPIEVRTPAELHERYADLRGALVFNDASYTLPLVAQGQVIGALGLSFASDPCLTDDDRALAGAIALQGAQALHRAELLAAERRAREDAERARQRIAFLSDAGAALNETLDYKETLQSLATSAVPFLADYALVDMLDERGHIARVACATTAEEKRTLLEQSFAYVSGAVDFNNLLHAAAADGKPRLVTSIDDATLRRMARNDEHLQVMRAVGGASAMVVPLRARSRTLGVVIFGRWSQDRPFGPADLTLGEELARRAAIAIDTAQLYEAAQEANRAKASFLAAVSHDLRQPLNASLGFLDIALMGLRGDFPMPLRDDLERVRRNQQHLLALINDVLSFARVEAGQLVVRREVVVLADVLQTLPSLVSPQADAKQIDLAIAACPSTLGVVGDPERVLQVFTNLLTNAIKATPERGRVSIECDPAGDVVLAHVRDSGIGIPPDMCDRIFEPFVQVSRSLNRPQEGIGLGLSISRNLARAMGGELTVDSRVGEGSTFTLRLPRAPAIAPVIPSTVA